MTRITYTENNRTLDIDLDNLRDATIQISNFFQNYELTNALNIALEKSFDPNTLTEDTKRRITLSKSPDLALSQIYKVQKAWLEKTTMVLLLYGKKELSNKLMNHKNNIATTRMLKFFIFIPLNVVIINMFVKIVKQK